VKETALTFGEQGHLAGILCEPDPKRARTGAPPVLLWNVGIQHRVGPYRIWVDLARRLAEGGFASLRFDLGGMGESEASRGSPAADLSEAMEALTRRLGASRFTLVGFCSSVDQLHEVGLKDPRVAGMVYVEGYAYRTRRFWLRYPFRFLSSVTWENRLKRRLKWNKLFKRVGVMDAVEVEAGAGAMFDRKYPPKEQLKSDLEALTARGTQLLLIYVGLDSNFAHPDQLKDLVGDQDFGGRLKLVFMGGADHIFYRTEDRALAVAEISRWMSEAFP
jgi:hypothetical protein